MKSMKLVAVVLFSVLSSSALASDGAIYDKKIEKFHEKIGSGMVYKNGKRTLKSYRSCALVVSDFATEAFDRDTLTIAFAGKALDNNLGVNPHGHYVGEQAKMMWDGPLFYDPTTEEKTVKTEDGGYGFSYCNSESETAFAENCDELKVDEKSWEQSIVVYPKRVEQTEIFRKGKKVVTTKVVCRFK